MADVEPRPSEHPAPVDPVRIVGRYALYDRIASGGMASVHFARLVGPLGFTRVVAVKRLHPQFAKDPEFVAMLLDEARLAARVRHPNVVPTIDVVATDGELFLVMEYVQGESLGKLLIAASEREEAIPPKIAITIAIQALWGLHAAHEAKTPRGASLGIIHRDVSPQNILVGDDGVVRIVDFGVAKAAWRAQSTREGQLKGKIAYMPPEQLRSEPNQDRRVDVYAASVCLWEALTGRRYVDNDVPTRMIQKLLAMVPDPPSKHARGLSRTIDAIVLRGLSRLPADRFATAYDMATELERAAVMASAREVGDWVKRSVGEVLERRARTLFEIEGVSSVTQVGLGPTHRGDEAEPARVVEGDSAPFDAPSEAPSLPYTPSGATGSATTELPVMVAAGPSSITLATPAEANTPADADVTEPADVAVLRTRSGTDEPVPMTSRARVVAVGVAAVVLLASGAWAMMSMSRAPASAVAADTATKVIVPPSAPSPIAPPAPAVEPSASPESQPTSVAIELPVDPPPPGGAVSAAAPSPRAARPNCHPPYTIDSEGVRIPKRECLHP